MSDLLLLVDLAAFTGVSPAAGRTCTMTQACSLDKLTGRSGWGIWSSGAQAGTWGHTGGAVKQGLGPVPDSPACLPQPEENLFWVKIMFYFIILIIQQKARHHLHLMHWLRDQIELVGCLWFLDTAHILNQTPFGTKLLLGPKAKSNLGVILNSCYNRAWHFHMTGRKLNTKSFLWWISDHLNNRHHLNYYPEVFGISSLLLFKILQGVGKDGHLFIGERLCSASFRSVLAVALKTRKTWRTSENFLALSINTE